MTQPTTVAATLLAGLIAGACSAETYSLDAKSIMDPAACKSCHPQHHAQWSGSMHAYAATDPVFVAMNARGQRETGGALGDFCVKCHAPLAVSLGLTSDGLNLAELPDYAKGVTCYFCHAVTRVDGTHNNPLVLGDDLVMRAGVTDPVPNDAHRTGYSKLLDGATLDSAALCGSCHDIVTPKGVHLERTFAEWQQTLYSRAGTPQRLSCAECHMKGKKGVIADAPGVGLRRLHDHSMPGVDIALTPFPARDEQKQAVQSMLNTTVAAQLCVDDDSADGSTIELTLENVGAGHAFPSGAAQDRRVWSELVASDSSGRVLWSTGVVSTGQALADVQKSDTLLWRFGDQLFGDNGEEVHMFWQAARYQTDALPAPTAATPVDPRYIDPHRVRSFTLGVRPQRVALRVRVRPMGRDVLADLEKSGDLPSSVKDAIPTFDLAATKLEWRRSEANRCVTQAR